MKRSCKGEKTTCSIRILSILFVLLFFLGCSNSPALDAMTSQTLTGTAATGAPIDFAQITVIDQTGEIVTTETDGEGKFTVSVADLKHPPFLLKADLPDNTSLYSIATEPGVANIHPLSDLIARLSYQEQRVDIAMAFEHPTIFPTPHASRIQKIKEMISSDLSMSLEKADVDPNQFDLVTTPFHANGRGFDGMLDLLVLSHDEMGNAVISIEDSKRGEVTEVTIAVMQGLLKSISEKGAPTVPIFSKSVMKADPASGAIVSPNQVITYTIDYINSGKGGATDVTITDVVDKRLTELTITSGSGVISDNIVSWAIGSVSSGASGSVGFSAKVATSTSRTAIKNQAMIASKENKKGTKTKPTSHLIPVTYTLNVKKAGTGGGVVTSSPLGIDCGADCSENFSGKGTTVTLTVTPDSGSNFSKWSGGCSKKETTTSVKITKALTCTAIFNIDNSGKPPPVVRPEAPPVVVEPPPPFTIGPDLFTKIGSDAPVILFSDIEYGPKTGGPNGLGVPISLFGKGFGASRGSSKVTIGGVEVGSYMVWGEKNAHNPTLDMIVVQPGANVSAGPIQVSVKGLDSNTNVNFTPVARAIYYISTKGSNSAACSEEAPCATIAHTVANVLKPGDTLIVRGGTYQENEIWLRSTMGGTTSAPKTIKRYPGEEVNLANGARPLIIDANNITVSGFNFQNGKSTGPVGWANPRQSGAKIIDNTFIGKVAWDAISSHGDNHVFAGNVCKAEGSSVGTQGHCYYISDGQNIKLLYNIGSGVPGYPIHIYDQRRKNTGDFQRIIKNVLVEGNILFGSPQRSGMLVSMDDEGNLGNYISDIAIRNNVFTGNNFVGLTLQNRISNFKVYNNTFYENGTQSLYIGTSGDVAPKNIDVYNNLFYQTMNNGICKLNCTWYTPAHIAVDGKSQNITIKNNYYGPNHPVAVNTESAGSPIANPETTPITGTITFVDPSKFNFRLNESIVLGIGAYY